MKVVVGGVAEAALEEGKNVVEVVVMEMEMADGEEVVIETTEEVVLKEVMSREVEIEMMEEQVVVKMVEEEEKEVRVMGVSGGEEKIAIEAEIIRELLMSLRMEEVRRMMTNSRSRITPYYLERGGHASNVI
ncbi:hypothetical protein CJ030_MR6G024325 [Morella rubra]|uniref:Uncharacterized protein n=1 Tax=Morella rubra TaxID=262757 RepID=A0A6A1V223_9ROSI|nr:hypothetical protein CJ030_MR7G013511 [Morella rubra]KAB1209277.1 hypothetical protein CJ030_MR6G024325 [Morella rubra]